MIILSILLLISIQTSIPYVSAETPITYFARIMYDNVFLYKQALDIDDYSNVYFELPRTYFVELLDEEGDFYLVNYYNMTGYVKKENVQTIAGTPQNPYLTDISFRIYSEQSRSLRTEPTELGGASTQITYIPLMSRNVTYLGKITGTALIDGRTNIWYYCKYTADKDYYGYVYSDFCDEMSTISENKEEVTYISGPTFDPIIEDTSLPMNDSSTTIIICILCVPALIFVFMILKSSIILNKEKQSSKEIKEY